MVASAENTARKYMEVRKALLRSSRQRGAFRVQQKNAPMMLHVMNYMSNALEYTQEEPMTFNDARNYFTVASNRRAFITRAYNLLPRVHQELNGVAHKIMAVRRIQPHWRKALQTARNKKRSSALRALNTAGSVPNTTRKIMNLAFPKPVYGPKTAENNFKSRRKYRTY